MLCFMNISTIEQTRDTLYIRTSALVLARYYPVKLQIPQSVCLSVYPLCLSICLFICLSYLYLSVYLSVYPICLPIYLSICLFISLSVGCHLSVYPICLSIYVSVCLSVGCRRRSVMRISCPAPCPATDSCCSPPSSSAWPSWPPLASRTRTVATRSVDSGVRQPGTKKKKFKSYLHFKYLALFFIKMFEKLHFNRDVNTWWRFYLF